MATSTPVTIGPILWDNFNTESASWREKARRFALDLPDRNLGQRIYGLLQEAFPSRPGRDVPAELLHSWFHGGTALRGRGARIFHACYGGVEREPADPGDDARLPTPGQGQYPMATGAGHAMMMSYARNAPQVCACTRSVNPARDSAQQVNSGHLGKGNRSGRF